MNRAPDSVPEVPSRRWIAWIVVALATALIGLSFLFSRGDDKPAAKAKAKRALPVVAAEVKRETITQRGRYPGELDADTADVAAFYAGRLVSVAVRVGDTVKKGDVIAELDPVDAREQIAQAKAQAKAAAAERQRASVERDAAVAEAARLEPLAKDRLISALEIDRQRAKAQSLSAAVDAAAAGVAEAQSRVRLLEKRIVESHVRAPFAGRVAERYVDPGATVTAGARLVRIVAVTPLRIRFEVPEADVPRLAVGTKLSVMTQAGEGVAATATVTGMSSEVSRERRVAIAEGLLADPPQGWLPGMYAEATVDLRTLENATIVPAAALMSRLQPGGQVATGVFVATSGVARWVPVREITRDRDRIAVEGDLAPGARVLVAGHVDLNDGALVTTNEPNGSGT